MRDITDSEKVIILHPDVEKIKAEVEKLRTELSMLLLEQDNLVYHECKNIEMIYMLAVGALEYKAYELECAILRARRKIELIQAKKNRQEKIVPSEIEEALDIEFEEYLARLEEMIGKMNEALARSKRKTLSAVDSQELKELYRKIVKALHPDLNPEQSEEKLELFYNAILAYECSDLVRLRIIHAMISDPAITDEIIESFSTLKKEKGRLAELLQIIKDDIDAIKSEYPYILKDIIQNPKKLEILKNDLENHIDELNEVLTEYKAKIEEMLR